MKIICPGGYTWKNKGDAALVLAMLAELRRVAPKVELSVISDSPDLDSRMYGERVLPPLYGQAIEPTVRTAHVSSFKRIWIIVRTAYDRRIGWRINKWLGTAIRSDGQLSLFWERLRFHAFLAWLYVIIKLTGRMSYRYVSGTTRQVLREFCEADLAVFVPGGYFIAPHAKHTYWFRHVAAVLVARWLGLPTYFYACTIGPFHDRYNQWLARRSLNHPHQIYVREQSSFEAVKRIAPKARCHLTADAGFLLPSCPPERVTHLRSTLLAKDSRPMMGISVRDYRFPGHPNPGAQREHYLDAMARTVVHVVEELGMTVYFVPQVLADEVNDLSVSREVIARLRSTEHVYLIDHDLDPRELKGLYGCFDLFIGVRMHANIFALSSGVPTVAIAYEPKTEGIMQQLGLSDFAVSIRYLDASKLIALVDRLHVMAPNVREQLATAVPFVQLTAMQTAGALLARLKN